SSAALTDFFTSSGPLAILSIISDKCRRRHAWEISTKAGLCESIPETPGSRATRKLGSKNDRDSGYFFDRVNAECLEVVPVQKSAWGHHDPIRCLPGRVCRSQLGRVFACSRDNVRWSEPMRVQARTESAQVLLPRDGIT